MTIRKTAIQKGEKQKQITTGRLTCGDCIGLNREVLISGEKKPCSDQGIKAAHKACPSFRPDCYKLREVIEDEDNVLSELGSIIAQLNVGQVRAFGAVLINESITRACGYKFYQRVFIRYRGTARSDYLSNFMAARILMADREKIRVCSDDGKIVLTYENTGSNGPSIYTVDSFDPLRELMIKKGRVKDPDVERATTRALRPEEADFDLKLNTNGIQGVVDISRVSKANGNVGKRKRGSGSEIVDLISIVSMIERGAGASTKKVDGTVVLGSNTYRRSGGAVELGDLTE